MPTNEQVTDETKELFVAAEQGDTSRMKILLADQHTNVNWRNGPKVCTRRFLHSRFNNNKSLKVGATALHAAVSNGKDQAAAMLLDNGADIHVKITTVLCKCLDWENVNNFDLCRISTHHCIWLARCQLQKISRW